MQKDVVILIGAGQIGMAIARRVSYGKKLVIGDKNIVKITNITGSDFLIDGGATASYFYGPLGPEKKLIIIKR